MDRAEPSHPVTAGVWEPDRYGRFAAERSAPFHDLVAMIGDGPRSTLVDLGCGNGELTVFAADELGIRTATGVDNDAAMIDAALSRVARPVDARRGAQVDFRSGDIAVWETTAPAGVDVIVASSSLHWVPDHPTLFARLARSLSSGGWLAVQVPGNPSAAFRTVADEIARREPFVSAFGTADPPPDPVVVNVLDPDGYSRLLWSLGFVDQSVVARVYTHVLDDVDAVVDWVRGSTLNRFKRMLPADLFERFVNEYRVALHETPYAVDGPVFFPFTRILMAARARGR